MVVSGLIVRADMLDRLTADFLEMKKRYRPTEGTDLLDYILIEIKGAALRSRIRSGGHRSQRYALGVLDRVVSLVEKYDIRLVGRIWVKEVDKRLCPRASYTLSIRNIADHFNRFLKERAEHGVFFVMEGRRIKIVRYLTLFLPRNITNQEMPSHLLLKHPSSAGVIIM